MDITNIKLSFTDKLLAIQWLIIGQHIEKMSDRIQRNKVRNHGRKKSQVR